MSLLKDMVKSKSAQTAIDLVAQLLTLFFLVIVIWYGFPMSFKVINLNVISPSMPWFKIGYVYILLPIAALFSVFGVLEVLISIILSFNKNKGA